MQGCRAVCRHSSQAFSQIFDPQQHGYASTEVLLRLLNHPGLDPLEEEDIQVGVSQKHLAVGLSALQRAMISLGYPSGRVTYVHALLLYSYHCEWSDNCGVCRECNCIGWRPSGNCRATRKRLGFGKNDGWPCDMREL